MAVAYDDLEEASDDSFLSDVFLNMHTILNEEVQSVDALGGTVELHKHDNGNYWIGAYPNEYITESDDFPIGIIRTPNTSDVQRGFRLSEEYYTFELQAYGRAAEHPSLIISAAWNALKKHEKDLTDKGLYSLTHGQTSNDMIMRGEMKVHEMVMPVTVRSMRCE